MRLLERVKLVVLYVVKVEQMQLVARALADHHLVGRWQHILLVIQKLLYISL